MKRRRLRSAGESIIDSFPVPEGNLFRFKHRLALKRWGPGEFDLDQRRTEEMLGPPPFNITVRKGSKVKSTTYVHLFAIDEKNIVIQDVALTREFVNDVLGNPVAWELRDWLAGALVPDEHFYSTLATIQVKNTLILLS